MKTITLFAAAIATIAGIPASAGTMVRQYTLTSPAGGYSASWALPTMPTPDIFNPGEGFAIERVSGTFPGTTAGDTYLDFFSALNGGGLSISDADGPALLVALTGRQLYAGTEDAPELLRGVFLLTKADGVGGYTLSVANEFGGVPEPATWALMILGMGAVGGAMRGRTRRLAVRYA